MTSVSRLTISNAMFRLKRPGILWACRQAQSHRAFAIRFVPTKPYDPLRILFCGSDEFSIASLKALHKEHLLNPGRIASIDVVCRPGKKVGRGLKVVREVPIKAAASKLSLPIHEIDTFKGWTPPLPSGEPINLVVAVSFGLFVPRRILTSAKYGGLNVHPSMLPCYHGPAPLHHVLMDGRTTTGVTLQTMHHQHFDHGVVLQQTSPPGLEIPDPDSCTVSQLLDVVTPKGAGVLLDGVRQGLFVPPLENRGFSDLPLDEAPHAAKITPEDRHISWSEWSWQIINRRNRVIGPLWGKAYLPGNRPGSTSGSRKRLIFTEMEEVQPLEGCTEFASSPGWPFVASSLQTEGKREEKLYVWTSDKKLIHLRRMIVEGAPNTNAARAARKAGLLGDKVVRTDDFEFRGFHDTLL